MTMVSGSLATKKCLQTAVCQRKKTGRDYFKEQGSKPGEF